MEAFDTLLASVQAAPPPGSLQLTVAGRVCGWAAADIVPLLRDRGARLLEGSVHLLPGLARQPVNPVLRAVVSDMLNGIAYALRDAGRLKGWRNEQLDVVSADGVLLGSVERGAVRVLGIPTVAVHLNAWTPEGRLWIAQRALTKSTDPGMWDTLVGGLVSAGESPEVALERESWEEAGLQPRHFSAGKPVGDFWISRHLPEGYQVERLMVVDTVLDAGVTPANQDGEVAALRTADPGEVLAMIAAGEFTIEAALVLLTSIGVRRGEPPRL